MRELSLLVNLKQFSLHHACTNSFRLLYIFLLCYFSFENILIKFIVIENKRNRKLSKYLRLNYPVSEAKNITPHTLEAHHHYFWWLLRVWGFIRLLMCSKYLKSLWYQNEQHPQIFITDWFNLDYPRYYDVYYITR